MKSISSDYIRGYIDLMILCILWKDDSYGYEISKKIKEKSMDTYSIRETTLYSAFSRLEKSGYLSSYSGSYSGGRERIYYKLTKEGQEHYQKKCDEWSRTKDLIDLFVI